MTHIVNMAVMETVNLNYPGTPGDHFDRALAEAVSQGDVDADAILALLRGTAERVLESVLEKVQEVSTEYIEERRQLEQDDLPTFTESTVPPLIERIRTELTS